MRVNAEPQEMNKQIAVNNLKALKKAAKELPEKLRTLVGYAERIALSNEELPKLEGDFPSRAYRSGDTLIPMTVVTPEGGHFMTTFFDVNPFSPSGRYLAVTQVPFIHRIPIPGDLARVCVIDLSTGRCRAVYQTIGWGAQLGANVQWGQSDDELYCNDVVEGRAVGVRIALGTGEAKPLNGPIYGITPDRRYSFSADLNLINAIIPGYGVPEPLFGARRQLERASEVEGIWKTDLLTGESFLFKSIADIVSSLPEQHELRAGKYYIFNVKVNPQGTRIFAILFSRGVPLRAGAPVQLITMDIDGSNVRLAMPDRLWRVGGHHPNWMPDGEHILMNLRHEGGPMAFVKFRYDGTDLQVVAHGHKGSGHPSLRASGRFLLTDAYVSEGFKDKAGEVPIRLIDLERGAESRMCSVDTRNLSGPRRIDPHPVWSQDGKRFAFNGVVGGRRQVIVGDASGL